MLRGVAVFRIVRRRGELCWLNGRWGFSTSRQRRHLLRPPLLLLRRARSATDSPEK